MWCNVCIQWPNSFAFKLYLILILCGLFRFLKIVLFLAVLSPCCCVGFFPGVVSGGALQLEQVGFSLQVVSWWEHRLSGTQASVASAPGLQSTGSVGVEQGLCSAGLVKRACSSVWKGPWFTQETRWCFHRLKWQAMPDTGRTSEIKYCESGMARNCAMS